MEAKQRHEGGNMPKRRAERVTAAALLAALTACESLRAVQRQESRSQTPTQTASTVPARPKPAERVAFGLPRRRRRPLHRANSGPRRRRPLRRDDRSPIDPGAVVPRARARQARVNRRRRNHVAFTSVECTPVLARLPRSPSSFRGNGTSTPARFVMRTASDAGHPGYVVTRRGRRAWSPFQPGASTESSGLLPGRGRQFCRIMSDADI